MRRGTIFRWAKPKPIVVLELAMSFEDAEHSPAMARLAFAELEVEPQRLVGQRFTDGRLRYFAIQPWASAPVTGCVPVMVPGRPTVIAHGSGCAMTQALQRDLDAGKLGQLAYCPESSFDVLAATEAPTTTTTEGVTP